MRRLLAAILLVVFSVATGEAASLHSFVIFDSTLTNPAVVTNTTPASNAYALATRETGSPTFNPGNTANTTPWLVKPHDGTNPLFTAAFVGADSVANPTQGGIFAFMYGWNGATWDRAKGGFTVTENGTVSVGSSNVSLVVNVPYIFDGNALQRANPTRHNKISGASTNATNVKGSRGVIIGISTTNTNAASRYMLLFNASGTPTCTNTPEFVLELPPSGGGHSPNLFSIPQPFATGIAYCLTTAQDGTGAVAANEVIVNMSYQ
jgi:hypothetical protein